MKKISIGILGILLTFVMFLGNIIEVHAASAKINVSSSTNKVVVGNTFTVKVKVSSSSRLGSWEFTIDYDTKVFKLMSGKESIAEVYTSSNQKSATYTYKFKAIASGNGKIGVKSYTGYSTDSSGKNTLFSMSANSTTVKAITQSELEASYSSNNNLSSITIDGYTLNPVFNKDTLNYKVELGSNVEAIKVTAKTQDSSARLNGTGTIKVSEGENKIELEVTAENGSKKKYTIIANVVDPNPISVTDTEGKDLVVVKRVSSLEIPDKFTDITIEIEGEKVPAFYNELNKLTLVGLKDNQGNIGLYMYNLELNTFEEYKEYLLNQLKILVLDIIENPFNEYEKVKIDIDGFEADALKINSTQYIIYAKNLENGENHYYIYDTVDNTVVKYDSGINKSLSDKVEKYYKIILILCGESVLLFVFLIILLGSSSRKNKKRRKELQRRKELVENAKSEEQNEIKTLEEIKPDNIEIKEKDKKKKDKKKNTKEEKQEKNDSVKATEEEEKSNEKKSKQRKRFFEDTIDIKIDEL